MKLMHGGEGRFIVKMTFIHKFHRDMSRVTLMTVVHNGANAANAK